MRSLCLLLLVALFAALCPRSHGQNRETAELAALEAWTAGQRVSHSSVEAYGIERCFVAEKLSDQVFARMWGKSYKESCPVRRADLRYIKALHYTIDGHIQIGEMVCNKAIAVDLVDIFRQLFAAKYPIERMVLIDDYEASDERSMMANNSSCFNCRYVKGTRRLSNHSRGFAVDINALYNPCVKRRKGGAVVVEPATARRYADRRRSFSYKIDHSDLCYKLFKAHGFTWGGDWKHVKDYQHFEKAVKP